ncbi:MAG: radical SAM protein [Candidatus Margulisbacteria bacterium]|nr:radical SAM protein [Candidatus Margulisiibacteriota bacterium]
MDATQKIRILKGSAKYDICSSSNPRSEMHKSSSAFSNQVNLENLGGVYQSLTPRGCSALFKVLQSNKCQHNCGYCANAKTHNIERTSLAPEELASTFAELQGKKIVQGLFLSSAVDDTPEKTMARMIKTVEIVKYKYNFNGYIHLKIMPGASESTIAQACRLASRVSVNMEAPSEMHLKRLSKTKKYLEILNTINIITKYMKKGYLPSGQTTQFVVGASGETDQNLLNTSENLYHKNSLRRVYFSAFSPIEGTLLENTRRADPTREHRLYQCDFLIREYGFKSAELVYTPHGQLPLAIDPKLNYALKHPELFPVEINSAPPDLLLKVPGIGPLSAKRIAQLRMKDPFRELRNLKGIGLAIKRAKPFILINGKKQGNFPIIKHQLAFNFSLAQEEVI